MAYKDPDAYRAYQASYREKNAKNRAKQHKEWRVKNAQRISDERRAKYELNKEKISAARKATRLLVKEQYSEAERKARSARARKRNSGFTPEIYEVAFILQEDECGVCRTDLTLLKAHRVHADHNHLTGAPRGILCASCNMALGLFKDSPERLHAAIAYLANPPLGFL